MCDLSPRRRGSRPPRGGIVGIDVPRQRGLRVAAAPAPAGEVPCPAPAGPGRGQPHGAGLSAQQLKEEQECLNETAGVNLNSGPALMAMKPCPRSSKETISESPEGVSWMVVVFVILEEGKVST